MRDASAESPGLLRSALSKAPIALSGSEIFMYASPSMTYACVVGLARTSSSWHCAYMRWSLR